MKVLAHVDPVVLERELLARVDAAHAADGRSRTLVLVPTGRLVEHLHRRLGDVRPAWLGLRVQHFRGLAREILERAGSSLHVADPLLLEALVSRLLRERPQNPWAEQVGKRPGTLGRLISTLSELREAGIDPSLLEREGAEPPRGRGLGELYAAYAEALDRCVGAGWTDDAGLARAALPHAGAFADATTAIFVHGAYELIGTHLDLLRELDRATPVTVLIPCQSGARCTEYAEAFARRFLLEPDGAIETVTADGDDARRSMLAALYDERARPEPAGEDAFGFSHSQGAAAEVKYAVRGALCALRDGCLPTEIAIVARTLEPYAAALEESLEDAGLVWTSSLASPLRRHPVVRDFLLLLRVLAEGFPRAVTVDLLRSPHIAWNSLECDRPQADKADRWSREARLLDGLEEWTGHLQRWAETPQEWSGQTEEDRARAARRAVERSGEARRLGETLTRLDGSLPRTKASWSEHADRVRALLESAFRPADEGPAAEALDHLRGVLDSMERLESLIGDRRQVSFEGMRAWLGEAVDAEALTLHREDNGGIRVLDAMQLRGLTFNRVFLLGMNSGLFPRTPREDPILEDGPRLALGERSSRPLSLKTHGTQEERLLLTMLVGSARERVQVSWQRADESGRAKIASLALREIGRIARGDPDMEALRASAVHLPSHPAQWLDRLVKATGLLAPREDMLLAALHSRAVDTAEELSERFPDLAPGLAMLRATQAFAPVDDGYDARIGPLPAIPLSVSAVQQLGSCPLKYFFQNVLKVREFDEAASPFKFDPRELGSSVHELLEGVYRRLRVEGLFATETAETLVPRGLELLEERRERLLGELGSRLAARLPLLWNPFSAGWFEAVRRFVRADLERIRDERLEPVAFEVSVSETVDFGQGCRARIKGRFDRRLEGASGSVVGDYKTSRKLDRPMDTTNMLQGNALQVPLYRMVAGGDATVELLGVHPELDPAENDWRPAFDGFKRDGCETSFRRTMQVILGLRASGIFPFREDYHCSWCPYDQACRRNHPPSVEREKLRTDSNAYRNVLTKTKTKPDGR